MSLKEYVTDEVAALEEKDLQAVAEYLSFLKFRSRTAVDEACLASLYGGFEQEDYALAEAGMDNYHQALAQEDAA